MAQVTAISLLWVALGGALGSVMRYLVSSQTMKYAVGSFPLGTLVVNLLGCWVIGILAYVAERYDWWTSDLRLLLITGVLGGFTTFSSFGLESFHLIKNGQIIIAVTYVTLSVLGGLALVGLGFTCMRALSS